MTVSGASHPLFERVVPQSKPGAAPAQATETGSGAGVIGLALANAAGTPLAVGLVHLPLASRTIRPLYIAPAAYAKAGAAAAGAAGGPAGPSVNPIFFTEQRSFDYMSLLKSPMFLILAAMGAFMVLIPCMMRNMSPEELAHFREVQKQGPMAGLMKSLTGEVPAPQGQGQGGRGRPEGPAGPPPRVKKQD